MRFKFLSFCDPGTDILLENFGPAAREGFQSGITEFDERVFDRLLRQPSEVQDLYRGEALQLEPRIKGLQRTEESQIVGEWQGRVEPTDNVEFGYAESERFSGLGNHLLDGKLEPVCVALFS